MIDPAVVLYLAAPHLPTADLGVAKPVFLSAIPQHPLPDQAKRGQVPKIQPQMREQTIRRSVGPAHPDARVSGRARRPAVTSAARRARERRQLTRSLRPTGELPAPGDDPSDCRHGCNGDCLEHAGPHECGYACHLP